MSRGGNVTFIGYQFHMVEERICPGGVICKISGHYFQVSAELLG